MTVEVTGDRPSGLAFLQAPATLCLLMLGQLGFATELHAACPGCLSPILRPLHYALALIPSERAQECQDALAHGALTTASIAFGSAAGMWGYTNKPKA